MITYETISYGEGRYRVRHDLQPTPESGPAGHQ
jgi:hypothetical protein